ncbi:MAG: hypothetical protein K2N48_01120 [Muribaculaceae bacterium]|nr:hypothetical protein [Muribaculaceae bacterium]
MEELLRLTRENNAMLKRIVAYIDKVDSDNYRMNEDMKQFAMNVAADVLVDNNQRQQRLDGNQQTFWR